jgi:hypothetical protein
MPDLGERMPTHREIATPVEDQAEARAPRLALLLALSLAVPAWGAPATDLILRQRTTLTGGPRPAPPREQTQYFSGRTMVIDDAAARSIVDLAAKTLTVVDKRQRTYTVTSFDDLRTRAETMRRQLRNMPPEARLMLGMDARASVEATGKREEIAGHLAREYRVSAGPATGSVWMTDEIAMPAGAEEWQQLSATLGGRDAPGAKLAEALAGLKGIPLRSTMTLAMGQSTTTSATEVVEVREAPVPPDVLRVPDGFRKTEPARDDAAED